MNKIKYLILPITLFIGFFLYDEKVSATTFESLTVEHQENVYYAMTGSDGYFSADPFSYYYMDGKTVYCIEQGVRLDNNSYIGEEGYTNSPFNFDTNRRIELIGHYGYDYPGHQTQKYRMATQALIWETITGYDVNFYTENYGWGDYINIDYEREQIMNLVNNHYSKPSFNNQTFSAILNQEFVIEDTNNIINEFEFYNKNDNDARIENNKLYVTPKSVGETTIQLFKSKYDTTTTFFYVASDGYSQKLAYFRASDPVYADIHFNVVGGKIKIKKVDSENNSCKASGQASLIGAKYGVYDSNNNLVDTLVIGNDCTATSKELPYGRYKVKEISSSVGYKIDTKVYDVEINSTNILEVVSSEDVIKGKIKIKKVDNETNACKSQGQGSLIGAKYGIYDINNTLVDTLIIDSDCTATSKLLPYGNYKVKEIESSLGYEIDTNIYDADIINTNIIEIISKEKVIKNFISILKQYDYVDETTQFLNAESNVTFEIYFEDGTKYGEITTDKNGYATLELPYGIWKFHQVNTHIGFEKIYDFFITVDENSPKDHYYNILNNKLSAYLKVIKVDTETGNTIAIADTTFRILNIDTNQYVSQFVAGKVYDTFKTDENGIMTTYLKLEAGNYKLIEVSSPHNYLINTDDLEFSIGEDTYYNYTTYGAFVTVYFDNQVIKGQIEVNKKGEDVIIENGNFRYEQKPLENVVFEIYANEDILSADGNALYYEKGQLVDTITTNKDGYAISKELYLGTYYIVETKTNDNYILDTKKYEFTLTQKDNKTPIVYHTYSAINMLKKGTLEFTKTDLVNGESIPNTTIEIYTDKDELDMRKHVLNRLES